MSHSEPYRPSNGTEGECFMAEWCDQCERDSAFQHEHWRDEDRAGSIEGCSIMAKTMVYSEADPEYPKEWCHKDGRPICTAFVPLGEKVPELPCTKTINLFAGE